MSWLAHLALGLAALYAAAVVAMFLAQTWLLFPTALAGAARVQLPASARRLEARTPDGEVLVGVRIPAAAGKEAERAPTLLGFGGNAWNADAVALHLHGLFPGREVAAFHYRGYAPSTGRPSAEALLADSALAFDRLQQAHAGGRGVVAVVLSIGPGWRPSWPGTGPWPGWSWSRPSTPWRPWRGTSTGGPPSACFCATACRPLTWSAARRCPPPSSWRSMTRSCRPSTAWRYASR